MIVGGLHTGCFLSLLMPAWDDTGYYGVKVVNIFAGNRSRGLPGPHSVYTLCDARTGAPRATVDASCHPPPSAR
jgi:ornithine cyclodeaminase